ncbi:hypothetical protein glysoja_013006 [Glycine soja]|nr:hypothetical protein glysoja_013006 [Glycine soja]
MNNSSNNSSFRFSHLQRRRLKETTTTITLSPTLLQDFPSSIYHSICRMFSYQLRVGL